MHAYIHTSIHPCIYRSMRPCILTYILTYLHTYILAYLHICILAYLHIYILTYLHTCILKYLHTYTLTCLHTCIRTYLHTYILAYLHTYTHARTHVRTSRAQPQHTNSPPAPNTTWHISPPQPFITHTHRHPTNLPLLPVQTARDNVATHSSNSTPPTHNHKVQQAITQTTPPTTPLREPNVHFTAPPLTNYSPLLLWDCCFDGPGTKALQ